MFESAANHRPSSSSDRDTPPLSTSDGEPPDLTMARNRIEDTATPPLPQLLQEGLARWVYNLQLNLIAIFPLGRPHVPAASSVVRPSSNRYSAGTPNEARACSARSSI